MPILKIQSFYDFENPTSMKIIHLISLITTLFGNIMLLDINARFWLIALGGSFGGALLLATEMKDLTRLKGLKTVVGSTLAGLVFGAAFAEWRGIEKVPFLLMNFFLSGMLSIFFVRSIIKVTEQNSDGITVNVFSTVIQRLFRVKNTPPRRPRTTRPVEPISENKPQEENTNVERPFN